MIVCLCKAVNERKIVDAIQQGCGTITQIQEKTSACTQCKKCACQIRDILKLHSPKPRRSLVSLPLSKTH